MNTLFFRQAAGLCALLALGGCLEPFDEIAIEDWEPEVAAPLLQTSFTLRDAIGGTAFAKDITEDEQGALHIGMDKDVFDIKIGQQFKVPKFTLPLFQKNTVVNFADLGVALPVSLVDLEDAQIILRFTNDYPSDAAVTVESRNFILGGEPLRHVVHVPAKSSAADTVRVPAARFTTYDENELAVRYRADLADGRQDVQLFGGSLALEARAFQYAEGYLSDLSFDIGLDAVKFDFLDAFEPGAVKLVNPSARLVLENSVGAPVRLSATKSSVGLRDGSSARFTSPLDAGLDFLYPSLAEGNVVKRSELIFDRETSNLTEVLNLLPNALDLAVRCQVNADTLAEKFFLYPNAVVRGRLQVDVPLALQFNGFEVRRTIAFDASALDAAASANLVLRVENGFGLAAAAQVRFLDRDGKELAKLFPQPQTVLAAAKVDAFGRVIEPAPSDLEIAVTGPTLRHIAAAASAEVILTLDSPKGDGAQFTQLFYDNTIAVKLGAKASFKPL